MHFGQYVFTQIASFLPKRYFERLVAKSSDRTKNWTPSPWSQLLVLNSHGDRYLGTCSHGDMYLGMGIWVCDN